MKNQTLFLAFLFLFSFTEIQAQDLYSLANSNKGVTQYEEEFSRTSNDEMQTTLEAEIKRFTDYVANEFEYPTLARDHCMEGEMIIKVVYNKGFESVEITKSINTLFDKMVMEHITAYINNFDRTYDQAPRLVFKIPINFRMEG